MLKSVSAFTLPVMVGDKSVNAIVDSAADVTIISDRLYKGLKKPPSKVKYVNLDTAGREMSMQGFIADPVKVRIGTSTYRGPVYVAPLEQDMLLGVDLLKRGDAVLNMGKGTLTYNGQVLTLDTDSSEGPIAIARVTVARRRVVPPNSVVKVECKISADMPDYLVEPCEDAKVFGPRVLCKAGTPPVMCIVNSSDNFQLLKKGKEVGRAYPVDCLVDDKLSTESVLSVSSREATTEACSDKPQDKSTPGSELPEHLKQMFDNSTQHLTLDQQGKLAQLLGSYQDVFATSEFDLGSFTGIEHSIDTADAKPVKQRMRRTPACFADEEEAHLKKMLEAGVIQESTSEWASSPVLIRKRDGSVRYCIDYREVNKATVKDTFPLPLVDDCLDTLAGNVWFTKLDANSAYWQVRIKPEDRKKTAFHTKYGLFEHVKMGFGLCNAPATFARVINLVLRGLNWKTVLAFLDDILVMGKSFNDHLTNLDEALQRFRQHGLKLKPKKCVFFQKEAEFLGRVIGPNKMAMTEEDCEVVQSWPTPTCSKDVERFMGLANYHRSFVKNFSELAEPLYSVVGKYNFKWGQPQESAFTRLKEALTRPPVLALPRQDGDFILDTDASNLAIGAELIQIQDAEERVVSYGSYALTKEQRRYCTTRKELLAIVRFTRQYRHYLLGRPFVVRTDHSSLKWLLNFKEPQGQLARWMEELSQYNMILEHRPGKKHGNADALSRRPLPEDRCQLYAPAVKLTDLPCGGCKYCSRADREWGNFTRDVDDTVRLTSLDNVETRNGSAVGGFMPGSESHGRELSTPLADSLVKGNQGKQEISKDYQESARVQCVAASNQVHGDNGKPVDNKAHVNRDDRKGESAATKHKSIATQETDVQDIPAGKLEGLGDVGLGTGDPCHSEGDVYIEILAQNGDVNVKVYGISLSGSQGTPTCWGYNLADLQTAQEADPNLTMILDWLRNSTEPSERDLFLASPCVKAYWLNKESFQLIDGVLYRQRDEEYEKDLVVPTSLQEEVMCANHDIPSAGHQGVARTKARIKEKFYWYGMGGDIANYVATCATCSQNKKAERRGHVPMQEYQASAPMERVHVDFLGPLPKTTRGNEYVLMMVDQFTKWVECVPLPSQTAEVTAKAAVDHFFSRFGYPFQVFSDQGRNFESKLFTSLCEVLEIHKARTTPYRPSANGQVERFNRTLMDAVRCYIGDSQNRWDEHLQQIAGALRSAVNRNTGFSANKLMLGREVNTPAYLMFPKNAPKAVQVDEYVATLMKNIQAAHNAARDSLKTSLQRMKRDYDVRVLQRTYEKGDVVYLLDTAVLKGKCRKLSSPWKGPAVVIQKLSSSLFRVKLQKSIFVVNHDRIKPCRDRKLPGWITSWLANPTEEPVQTEDSTLYCLCRKPCNGRFMIQCDICEEWFHGSCVNITASDALTLDKFMCTTCNT